MADLSTLTPGTWTIDPDHTEVGFIARHLMVTKVRGSFGTVTGTVVVPENVTDSSVSVDIETASVTTGNDKRDEHVRSGDFLDVEAHPQMTFVSTKFDGETLTGDLTIRGITRPVELDVDFEGVAADPWGNTKAGFEAKTKINRQDWDLNWNVALETGGVLVSDQITIVIDAQLLKTA